MSRKVLVLREQGKKTEDAQDIRVEACFQTLYYSHLNSLSILYA